jgi:AbiTii
MLIDDIIQLLSNEQGSLTEALLKTKLLLHQVQRKDLVSWVNHELTGYPEAADLPDYRILESRVKGDLMAPGWMANDQAIPIMHLEKDYREKLEKSEMRESLALVQELATKPQSSIRQPFPPEANRKLGSNLGNGWKIQSAWCEISVLSVQNILIQVRSRLLDFVLELKDSLGGATSESEIKEKSSSLDMTSMFNNAIFGSNTTIVVGNNNIQRVESSIIQGDFDSLGRQLKQLGIDDAAIHELHQIECHEKSAADPDKKTLKERVTGWLKEQAGKQLDVQSQAALAVSVDTVVHAVRTYFGF